MIISCPVLIVYVEAALNDLEPVMNFGLGGVFMEVWKSVYLE